MEWRDEICPRCGFEVMCVDKELPYEDIYCPSCEKYFKKKSSHLYLNEYFAGIKIPEQDYKLGYISWSTISEASKLLICNNLPEVDEDVYCNMENNFYTLYDLDGNEVDEEIYELREEGEVPWDDYYEEYPEIFQWFLCDEETIRNFKQAVPDIIYGYSNKLDLNFIGVTHFRTSWTGVETHLKLIRKDKDDKDN